MNDTILETVHLTREFGGFVAVDDVSLEVREPLEHWTLTYDGAGELTDSDREVRGLSGAGPIPWGRLGPCQG